MKRPLNSTLAATLIATAAGIGVWLSGAAEAIWPAHPQIAAFLITIGAGIAVQRAWPVAARQPRA